MPCIVCGHATGDCTGDSGPPLVIFGQGSSESIIDTQTILVEEDIYEDRQITPFTRAKVLLHKKGKQIPFREAEKLGLVERPKLTQIVDPFSIFLQVTIVTPATMGN